MKPKITDIILMLAGALAAACAKNPVGVFAGAYVLAVTMAKIEDDVDDG